MPSARLCLKRASWSPLPFHATRVRHAAQAKSRLPKTQQPQRTRCRRDPCSDSSNRRRGLLALAGAVGRKADDVARIEVGQLEPVLGDVAGREKIVLAILLHQCVEEILAGERTLRALFD